MTAGNETGSSEQLYRLQPAVLKDLLELDRQYAKALTGEPRLQWLVRLVFDSWRGGDQASAAKALADVPPAELERRWGGAPRSLAQHVAETALFTGKGWSEYTAAQQAFTERKYDKAVAGFESTRKVAAASAQPFLQSRLRLIAFERELDKGEWMKVTPTPGLIDWTLASGLWRVDPDGKLVTYGRRYARLLYQVRPGPNFEIRGKFEIESKADCCHSMAVVIGAREIAGSWMTCTTYQDERGKIYGTIYELFGQGAPAPVVKLKLVNEFLVRVEDGLVTYVLNGATVFARFKPESERLDFKEGQIGFAIPNCGNNVTKISEIEVRRVKPEPGAN